MSRIGNIIKKWCEAAAHPSGRERAIEFRSRTQGNSGIVELARKAATSGRTKWAAWVAATRPVRNYRDLQQRKKRYYAVIWNIICEICE
jgi:hypothetical protein